MHLFGESPLAVFDRENRRVSKPGPAGFVYWHPREARDPEEIRCSLSLHARWQFSPPPPPPTPTKDQTDRPASTLTTGNIIDPPSEVVSCVYVCVCGLSAARITRRSLLQAYFPSCATKPSPCAWPLSIKKQILFVKTKATVKQDEPWWTRGNGEIQADLLQGSCPSRVGSPDFPRRGRGIWGCAAGRQLLAADQDQ